MIRLRQSRFFAAGVVALTLLAWMGASNHCALASLCHPPKSAHQCCQAPKSAPVQNHTSACCDSLNAPLPVSIKAPDAQWTSFSPVWSPVLVGELPSVWRSVEAFTPADIGPPTSSFLIKIVLRHSLPSHAPPSVVV